MTTPENGNWQETSTALKNIGKFCKEQGKKYGGVLAALLNVQHENAQHENVQQKNAENSEKCQLIDNLQEEDKVAQEKTNTDESMNRREFLKTSREEFLKAFVGAGFLGFLWNKCSKHFEEDPANLENNQDTLSKTKSEGTSQKGGSGKEVVSNDTNDRPQNSIREIEEHPNAKKLGRGGEGVEKCELEKGQYFFMSILDPLLAKNGYDLYEVDHEKRLKLLDFFGIEGKGEKITLHGSKAITLSEGKIVKLPDVYIKDKGGNYIKDEKGYNIENEWMKSLPVGMTFLCDLEGLYGCCKSLKLPRTNVVAVKKRLNPELTPNPENIRVEVCRKDGIRVKTPSPLLLKNQDSGVTWCAKTTKLIRERFGVNVEGEKKQGALERFNEVKKNKSKTTLMKKGKKLLTFADFTTFAKTLDKDYNCGVIFSEPFTAGNYKHVAFIYYDTEGEKWRVRDTYTYYGEEDFPISEYFSGKSSQKEEGGKVRRKRIILAVDFQKGYSAKMVTV